MDFSVRIEMVLHNLVIYNRLGIAVYYEDFNRKRPSPNLAHELNLLYGMVRAMNDKTNNKNDDTSNNEIQHNISRIFFVFVV